MSWITAPAAKGWEKVETGHASGDGYFYNAGVDANVQYIETPDFEEGFDYLIEDRTSCTGNGGNKYFSLWLETSALWLNSDGGILGPTTSTGGYYINDFYLTNPRASTRVKSLVFFGSRPSKTVNDNGSSQKANSLTMSFASAEPAKKARFYDHAFLHNYGSLILKRRKTNA